MKKSMLRSVRELSENICFLIDNGDIDLALNVIHDFVERIITEPLCTSQVFGSKILDDLCRKIGGSTLARLNDRGGGAIPGDRKRPVVVYIVTKIQKSGGHTRVIEDFIKARPEAQHVILSTEISGQSDSDYILNGISKQADVVFERSKNTNYLLRLTWLQERLIEIHPRKVYLFNHHQDSVAVSAIQPEMKLDASFYHHGDHHLCLGVYLPHVEHIDPHPMGYHNCRDVLGIENTYMPLTVDDKGDRPSAWPIFHDGTLVTCTAGRSNKIEIPYFVSYLDVVPKLLKTTGGRHIHIGRLSPWALFTIRRGLKRNGIAPDRFVYTPWVPSVWKALHDYRVDLYIASFPYGGGLTLIEAMGAGVAVALHRHIFSRVLSGIELAYPGVFSWRLPEELLNYCSSVSAGELIVAGRLGRAQYEKFHAREILRGILDGEGRDVLEPSPLSEKFSVQSDEWALWMERQLSLSRVLSRAAYRIVRRFRSWWQ